MAGFTEDAPRAEPWSWALTAFVSAALVVATIGVSFIVAWEGDRAEYEEHRALFFASALARTTAQAGPAAAQKLVVAASSGDTSIEAAYVIRDGGVDEFGISRGQAYETAMDRVVVGQTLFTLREAPPHKDRGDRYARSTSGVDEKAPAEGRVHPTFALEVEPLSGGQIAMVPIFEGDGETKVYGAAGVLISPTMEDAPVPWLILALMVLLIGGAGGAVLVARPGLSGRARSLVVASVLVVIAVGGGGFAVAHYQVELALTIDKRAADMEAHATWSEAAGVEKSDVINIIKASDRYFTGATGYLGEEAQADTGGYVASVAALSPTGRRLVIILSCLLALLLMLGLHRPMAQLLTAARYQPHAYLYVVPSLFGMLLLVFVPFGFGVGLSAFDNDARRYYFVGFDNFIEIIAGSSTGDVSFYWTLFVTVLWTTLNIALHVSIGLGLALLLKDPLLKFKKVYRVLLVVPWAIPNYITALIWKGMFNKEFGAVNLMIGEVQGWLGMEPSSIDWLGGGFLTAFIANLVTNTWLGFPFMMVVSLGALQSIPRELYEAADVDGASRWQQFKHITLPLLKPALFPAIILGTIWTFNMFNVIYLVSGGGPNNSTEILITDAYRAFDVLGRYGFAAAYSVVIFLILFAYTMMTNRITKATEGALG